MRANRAESIHECVSCFWIPFDQISTKDSPLLGLPMKRFANLASRKVSNNNKHMGCFSM